MRQLFILILRSRARVSPISTRNKKMRVRSTRRTLGQVASIFRCDLDLISPQRKKSRGGLERREREIEAQGAAKKKDASSDKQPKPAGSTATVNVVTNVNPVPPLPSHQVNPEGETELSMFLL